MNNNVSASEIKITENIEVNEEVSFADPWVAARVRRFSQGEFDG